MKKEERAGGSEQKSEARNPKLQTLPPKAKDPQNRKKGLKRGEFFG
ncbi:MAG TPA: hypothetical protein PK054_00215 [Anaerohalosphaeraceae bacterium]|nr:hypothetical protein [Anaerohalosphaeraceae bacterium]HOL89672.1 hypothetical protein [Anaerohalosphaeraceae bacterium]HPP54986.1 hypothetical protein [Anaerohalosphaeraceae bacterium]